jgi:tRNA(fMet)-specific endonuclease VapC
VVKAELFYGARKSSRVAAENLRLLQRFFCPLSVSRLMTVVPNITGSSVLIFEYLGNPIGPNDLMIATTAKAYDLVLITHNTREFSRIVGLQLEDWE